MGGMAVNTAKKRIGSLWHWVAICLLPTLAFADYRLERIADDLDVPWGMVQLPNRDLLISERDGRLIRIADGGRGARTAISGVPKVSDKGQGGLLDLALHPAFESNSLLYFSYAKPQRGGSQTAVARGRLVGDELVDVESVFAPAQASRGGRHYGSRLAFDNDN